MYEKNYQEIYHLLNKSNNILLVTHIGPDPDALGSLLALYRWLSSIGKNLKMYINDSLPPDLNFLPFFDYIITDYNSLLQEKFDLIVYLDCGDLKRTGIEGYLSKISHQPASINIDHHLSNDNFADYNLVAPEISSTSEILYNFFKYFGILIEQKMATALLTGIIGDTDFFANPNTNPETFKATSHLIKCRAQTKSIFRNIYQSYKIKNLKLWGKALARLNIDQQTGLAVTVILQDDLEDMIFDDDALNGLSNFLNNLDGVQGIMLLKEEESGIIKGSLRTTKENVNMEKIAKVYGGGGHRKAAGFRVRGRIVKKKDGGWKIEKSN